MPRPNDIALVLDRSGSILNSGALEEVQAATQYLIDEVNLQTDQLALVTFNESASIDVPLSHDRDVLTAAVAALSPEGGTNIAAGVDMAIQELGSSRHNPEAQPVIVLLSDGLAKGDDSDALAAAEAAKASGIHVITIGLGPEVNSALLERMASTPKDFYLAITEDELEQIYKRITEELICQPAAS